MMHVGGYHEYIGGGGQLESENPHDILNIPRCTERTLYRVVLDNAREVRKCSKKSYSRLSLFFPW